MDMLANILLGITIAVTVGLPFILCSGARRKREPQGRRRAEGKHRTNGRKRS
jgi:hypothetical protein